MKKLIVLFLCLCLTAGILPALAESAPSFTVKNVPVTDGNSDLGSLDVRFLCGYSQHSLYRHKSLHVLDA